MDPTSNRSKPAPQTGLNAWAESTLDAYGEFSVKADKYMKDLTADSKWAVVDRATTLADMEDFATEGAVKRLSKHHNVHPDTIRWAHPSLSSGFPAKVIRFGGSALNAALGVIELGVAVKQDKKNGYKDMSNSLKTASKVTLQATAIGTVGATAAGMVGGAAFAPFVVGGALGLAAGYVAGKVFEGAFSLIR